MQGSHRFVYHASDGSSSLVTMVYYTKGEMKKTGWNNELVAQEYIDLYIFDPLHTRLPVMVEMLERAQEAFGQKEEGVLRFQRWNSWKEMWESRGADEPITTNFSSLVFYEERLISRVYEEVEAFLATPPSELLTSGLPLKLGFLFHGPPGTGKTHLVRHLAARYGLDIDIIDMNSGNMSNESLLQCFNMAAGIILLEDIDNVDAAIGVRGPDDRKESRRVTLDGLLNALDGVQRGASKRIIIATTNYPEKLMPSIRRRGRLGLSFEITYPSDPTLKRLLEHHLPAGANIPETIEQLRAIETRLGLPAPTAALTDIFGKAGLRSRLPGAKALDGKATTAKALQEVDEVLSEVVSTNKKVFKTIDEVLAFLELSDAWTAGDRGASGLVWRRIGTSPPSGSVYGKAPRELCHSQLSRALAKQLDRANGKVVDTAKPAVEKENKEKDKDKEKEEAATEEPLDPARLTLKDELWKKLDVKVTVERYVRVEVDEGVWYFAPEDADDKLEARPKTYSRSFAEAGCASALLCKKLDDRQLEHTLKIENLGDRMRLLEQFRFL